MKIQDYFNEKALINLSNQGDKTKNFNKYKLTSALKDDAIYEVRGSQK
ncbi:MAG: hypothetical protein RCG15_02720 [Candidatus Rickettsia vulgarisii]